MGNINNHLATESGRIGKKLHKINRFRSPWLELPKKEHWTDEMGASVNAYVHQRSGLSGSTSWSSVSFNDGTGNTCAPAATTINPAHDLEAYNLEEMALESHDICVNDARMATQFRKQLDYTYDNLADNTKWELETRARSEQIRLSNHKIILGATPGADSDATTWGTTASGRSAGMGAILKYGRQLSSDAGGTGAIAKVNGQPIYTVICSQETYDNAIRENAEFRDDIRHTGQSGELLAALGVTHSYRGFVFIVDPDVPRYTHTGSSYVRVQPYIDDATVTEGTARVRNPDYYTATHEDTVIFHPDVYTCLTPKPLSAAGGNTKFEPDTYMGDWKWRNVLNMDSSSDAYNPDGKYGKFRGLFMNASEPVKRQYGYVLRGLSFDFMNQGATSQP